MEPHFTCCFLYNKYVCFIDCSCLRCFKCFSSASWEDCNQHTREVICDEEEICFMAHRIFKIGKQQHHNFIKDCYFPEWCPAEMCRKTGKRNVNGSWCETKCCDFRNMCNTGVTPLWERQHFYNTGVTASGKRLVQFVLIGSIALITGQLWVWSLFPSQFPV